MEHLVRALWSLCRSQGVTPALLVVPNWHGEWPLARHAAFVAWLRQCAAEGAEVILHGDRHDEVGLPRGWRDHVRAVGRTNAEGEFLTLSYAQAGERIARGLALFSDLRLSPIGFIPPAWLAREATHDAVRDAGLRISEDARGVRLHPRGVLMAAPALRWSGRGTFRAWGSRALATMRWTTHRHSSLIRLALHPQDLMHPVTAESVARETARWIASGTVVRYAQLQP